MSNMMVSHNKFWSTERIFTVIGLLVAVAAIITALLTPEIRKIVGLDPRVSPLLQDVENLAPGVDIGVYESEFGKPTIINNNETPTKIKEKEYVFVNTDFYVDAVTDMNDQVLYFTVTTRNGSFHPVFKKPTPITLGVSKFTAIAGGLNYLNDMVACQFSGPRFSYYETHYYGWAADYEDFGFGVNPAVYFDSTSASFDNFLNDVSKLAENGYCPVTRSTTTVPPGAGPTSLTRSEVNALENNLRSNTVINTYAVSTDTISDLNVYPYLGVEYDQVQLLNPQ